MNCHKSAWYMLGTQKVSVTIYWYLITDIFICFKIDFPKRKAI